MTEHAPTTEHARWICGKCARLELTGRDDIPEHHWSCPKRIDLAHQLQEYTDTTARYQAGEDVIPGDCWRACLASLLEVPLAEVPHFIHLYPEPAPEDDETVGARWWYESIAWVEQQRPGWTLAAYDRPDTWRHYFNLEAMAAGPGRCILTAPSPRGPWNHSVLVDIETGRLEHDPFPGGQGVLEGPGDVVVLVRREWL